MPGTLFIVATPIGNLEDLTFRALRTLREVDLIAAEDTRRTARLLARYEIRKSMVSLREQNERRETPRMLERLRRGESIALVSDAGTPGISDPGSRLVAAAREAGLPVVAIPGPSAVTAALSSAGVPADEFAFLGFPPSSGKARQTWIDRAVSQPGTVVFFESPHRIRRTVGDLVRVGIRPIYALREISKIHEQLVICHTMDDAERLSESGEYTVVVAAKMDKPVSPSDHDVIADFGRLVATDAPADPLVFEFVAWRHRTTADVVKKIIKKATISAKQQNGTAT